MSPPAAPTPRTFGVEEELLIVDADTLAPAPLAAEAVARHAQLPSTGHQFTLEFQREQIEVSSPPQTTLAGQEAVIRAGRSLADRLVGQSGGRVVALPTAPGELTPHPAPGARVDRINARFGRTAAEALTCGFHVHVLVHSRAEGVGVLDRIRVWLPTLLALSANSPFWGGFDTGFASYRHQVWGRWPTAGPTDLFGSPAAHDRHQDRLLASGVPLDTGMLYLDARLCTHLPTVEVRVADVCLEATHAAALAALIRALVETAAREWHAGGPAPDVPTSLLRAWSWQASRHGGAGLLDHVAPALSGYGELVAVESAVGELLGEQAGFRRQRAAFAHHGQVNDIVSRALEATHRPASAEPAR